MSEDERPLEEAARALRLETSDPSSEAARTRARILATHAANRRRRDQLLAAAAALLLVFVTPTAWAWWTGRLDRWIAAEPSTEVTPRTTQIATLPTTPPAIDADALGGGGDVLLAPSRGATTVDVGAEPEPRAVDGASRSASAASTGERQRDEPRGMADVIARDTTQRAAANDRAGERAAARSAERMAYREAHGLHFDARDPSAALTAWDRYLASYGQGRFAVEARYNRALCLVRLGRAAEAREALTAFAEGHEGDYRQREARALLDALE